MRKIGFLLLSILLSVSLVGCGQKSLTSDDSSNESQKQYESKELLPYTYNVPLKNIYVLSGNRGGIYKSIYRT